MRGRPKDHEWCDVAGCGGKHYAKGKCQRHYRRERRGISVMKHSTSCKSPHCADPQFRGSRYCLAHTLEREFHERGGDASMLPQEG